MVEAFPVEVVPNGCATCGCDMVEVVVLNMFVEENGLGGFTSENGFCVDCGAVNEF